VPVPPFEVLSEPVITIIPRPGEERKGVLMTYQATGYPPRTVQIDLEKLPDRMWELEHPDGPPPPEEAVRQGNEVRKQAVEADLARAGIRQRRVIS